MAEAGAVVAAFFDTKGLQTQVGVTDGTFDGFLGIAFAVKQAVVALLLVEMDVMHGHDVQGVVAVCVGTELEAEQVFLTAQATVEDRLALFDLCRFGEQGIQFATARDYVYFFGLL